MKILNYTDCDFGLLVVYSEHYIENHYIKPKAKKKIGIITEKKFFEDSVSGVICYPCVYWEGGVMSSMVHPINIKPYRKNVYLPTIEVSQDS